MPAWVIDTNVAVAANLKASVSLECAQRCAGAIQRVVRAERILALDDMDLIFDEYIRNMSLSGQPGLGDVFAKWVADHRYDRRYCTRVAITPRGDERPPRDFEEFPDADELAAFDRADRKFVAVAIAGDAEILQGTDSKWWGWRAGLAHEGVKVKFLCRDELEAKHQKKQKRKKRPAGNR